MLKFSDAVTVGGTRKTDDGYLIADAFAVRTGIQVYRGEELDLPDQDEIRVWRPEDEVRSPQSLRTFSHAPITLGHPQRVTADNWKDLAKGEVSTEAEWDGNKIKLPLIIKDAEAIAAVEGGVRELSAGYVCQIEFTDGVTPEGEPYGAIQRDIRVNHLAIVPNGRAGSECRIGDGADKWGAAPLTPSSKREDTMSDALKTVVLGDQAAQVAVADAAKVEDFKAATAKEISDLNSSHKKAIDAKDEEIGKLKADLKKAQDAAMTPEKLRQAAKDRATLEATAKAVDDKIDLSLDDTDLRKAAVAAKMGDEAIKDASDAEITGMFRVIAADEAGGGTNDPLKQPIKKRTEDADPWAKFNTKKEA
ncbi:DUF2213 domain-containing protein [uncultured Ruegeria sp.]|uniref:DUF2213 domain-containing protein n=1 Tax=uncultured Ruegeria sp. TaxID=259304 RepID=UPI00260249A1|nr:DUF2213 domain-containing protein [uncultured Ruegeria sp.]